MINGDRTMRHIADHMANPPPEELVKEAVAHYGAITELIRIYRAWYAGETMVLEDNVYAIPHRQRP